LTIEENVRANDSPTKDMVAAVLLGISAILGVVTIFYRPFGVGVVALFIAIVAITISAKHRALGLYVTGGVTLCWIIGASIAVWDSNSLY
jgi:hypothetical protein